MLRTQARSGSTYLMQLLSNFPDIVATKVHPYEVRIAQYYAACFETLSGTANHETSSRPNFFHRDKGREWIGANPFNHNGKAHYQQWIKNKYNPSLESFLLESIEDYYQNEACQQQKKSPKFFCEKSFYINRGSDRQDANVMHALSKDCIDIYLVRDPLDILVSQVAFFRQNKNLSFDKIKKVLKNLANQMNKMVVDYKNTKVENKMLSTLTIKEVMKNIAGNKKPKVSHIIYYEELIVDPSNALLKLSECLQLNYDKKSLGYIIEKTSSSIEKNILPVNLLMAL